MMHKISRSGPSNVLNAALSAWQSWGRWLPLGLAFTAPQLLRAENHVDYRYGFYDEDDHRMKIETHSVYFEQKLVDAIIARGELIYDGISGATPTGTYRIRPTSGKIKTVQLHDIRRAGDWDLDLRLGNQTITPGFAYSKESDYLSYGVSLNDAIEFNEKNTTLLLGVSHNFDEVQRNSNPFPDARDKDGTEGIIGISQLLTPKTVLAANFTIGYETGYLSDPYRQAEFVYPLHTLGVVRFENRPSHRAKQVFLTSLTQFINPLNASVEGSYRFYHDSFGVYAHTVGLTWHQWVGKHLIIEPMFRFYEQSAASFYSPLFHSNPANVLYFSADYRLSRFYSLDYGVQATVVVNSHVRLNAGYHRYEMNGLDNTNPAMYPQANIYSAGISILW
jgi:hypothetical protein